MTAHRVLRDLSVANFVVSDPGASGTIKWDRDRQVTELTPATGAAETRTLLGPTVAGPRGRLDCTTFVTSSTTTVTIYDSAGGTSGTIAFSAAGQWANLEAFKNASGNYEWRVQESYGATITTIPQVATTTNSTSSNLTSPVIIAGLTASGSAANDFSGSTGTFKTSTGTNTFGGNTARKCGASVTAAGSSQTDATALNEGDQVLVTGVTGQTGYGVKFPSASFAGKAVLVQNITAFACKLYPYSTEDIGAGASTAVTLAASTAVLVAWSAAGVGRVWTVGAQVTS
jgi:hypothetical protein